jgi:hypothetical protein
MTPHDLIFAMLSRKVPLSALPWLEKTSNLWRFSADGKMFFSTFSAAQRFTGKAPLAPLPADLAYAGSLVPGWDPEDWTVDQAARVFLLLSLPLSLASEKLIDALYDNADLGEAVAILDALPLLPDAGSHLEVARKAIRSNARPQFEAIALRNPYPMRHFDDLAWNQMVAKAIFLDCRLEEILGADERANAGLDLMLTDLLRERAAARRTVNPGIVRFLSPRAAAAADRGAHPATIATGSPQGAAK